MDLKTGPTRVDISSCMHAHHGTVAVAAGVVIGHWAVTLSDPRPRLDHDWTTTPPQLDHGSIPRLHHNPTTARPRLDHDSTTTRPRLDHSSTDSLITAPSRLDHCSTTAPPRLDHDSTTARSQLDHKSTTAQQSTAPDSHHIDPAAAVQAA